MAVYDILRTSPAGADMQFTADSTVASVPITLAGSPIFVNRNGNQNFVDGDNIIIQKLWVSLPHGLILDGNPAQFIVPSWNAVAIQEISSGNGLWVPQGCGVDFAEPLAIFVSHPGGGVAWLILDSGSLSVSMANLPAILDGVTFTAAIHLLVKHTQAMT